MEEFAALLDALSFTPSRASKLRLITNYLAAAADPDRGWALAALTGDLDLPLAKPAMVRALVATRVDPALFAWSYDFVGDLAETVALVWPEPTPSGDRAPPLGAVIDRLLGAGRGTVPDLVAGWLDLLDATGRWALLKLITGGLRVGVSARLAKTAVAALGGVAVDDVEEVWHGLRPPYPPLFAWLTAGGPRPLAAGAMFRPVMLAHPLEEEDLESLDPGDFSAEWKWDGIRVQVVGRDGERRLYTRTGDEISKAFPDIVAAIDFEATLDGELLVGEPPDAAPFATLQRRLNRKTVTARLLAEAPAFVRLYDMLFDGPEDLRAQPLDARRARLADWFARQPRARFDLSPEIGFADWAALAELRDGARANAIEGLMVKRRASPYVAGRPRGEWFKWKRGALTADCVLMYAQRGHGKRSSFYSDYTFGCWRDDALVPVGKAYSGFTDAELIELDRWVRNHTVNRFGPVREVARELVLEIAFDGVQRSTRHKSGVAMRFPRVARIRWDKPAAEADHVATLARFIGA